MKKLLQSKKFRRNLYRWLTMYGVFMLLFTLVVTYARYVTSMSVKDSARVAKFNVDIYPAEDCTEGKTENCNRTEPYRPTSYIDYYFVVDTTNLEVKTKMTLVFTVNDKLYKPTILQNENGDNLIEDFGSNTEGVYTTKYIETILPGNGNKKFYKLRLEMKNPFVSGIIETTPYNIVTVGFSAKQIIDES